MLTPNQRTLWGCILWSRFLAAVAKAAEAAEAAEAEAKQAHSPVCRVCYRAGLANEDAPQLGWVWQRVCERNCACEHHRDEIWLAAG